MQRTSINSFIWDSEGSWPRVLSNSPNSSEDITPLLSVSNRWKAFLTVSRSRSQKPASSPSPGCPSVVGPSTGAIRVMRFYLFLGSKLCSDFLSKSSVNLKNLIRKISHFNPWKQTSIRLPNDLLRYRHSTLKFQTQLKYVLPKCWKLCSPTPWLIWFLVLGKSHVKVHIFWESHKILQNLHQLFDWQYIEQIIGGDFAKFCGLLKIYELKPNILLSKLICSKKGREDCISEGLSVS